MRLSLIAASVLAAAISPLGLAQNETMSDEAKLALAAGYKALFTCSATFNADQSRAVIEANELDGIYTGYRPLMSDVSEANINERKRLVTVKFDAGRTPRIAAWRPGMGCSLLPVGAGPKAADYLPGFSSVPDNDAHDASTALGDSVVLTSNTLALDRLEAPVSFAFDGETYGKGTRTSAVVVVHKGQVIAERYARGITADKPQLTWSVAKSLTATVLGAAVEDGLIGLDNNALIDDFNQGADPRREITLRNLLNMASGLESGSRGSRTDRVYFGGVKTMDMVRARMLEVEPGTRFKYSNYDTLIAMRYLRETLDDDAKYFRYPYTAVLEKIGATSTILETDWDGDFVSSSQVWMTARDMARLGQLYLQNGNWAGEQILPIGWAKFVSTPAPAQPGQGDFGYGGAFWLLGGVDGVPDDAYAGLGNRGQHMVIVPSRDLVIVRRGYDVAGKDRFEIAKLTGDIVAVLDRIEQERLAVEAAAAAELDEEAAENQRDAATNARQRNLVRSKVGRR